MRHYLLKSMSVPSALRWVVLIVWMAIFLTYLLQTESQPILATGIRPGPPTPLREAFFSSVHLAAYTFTTLLWVWALRPLLSLRQTLITTFVLMIGMSILTELGQTLTPDRHFQWIDLVANLAGVSVGLIVWKAFSMWRETNLVVAAGD